MIGWLAIKKIRHTTIALWVFVVVALCLVAIVTQVLIGGIGFLFGLTDSVFEWFVPATIAILCVWVAMFIGAALRWVEVRSGGAVVARRLGAVQASNRSRHESEKTLMHVVSAIAIASGCKRPNVFVLRDELSINSLTVGSLSGDTALVVTQGALEALTRDEVASVVAHECAHIANGDVPKQMRLMIALAGLLALDQMGQRLALRGEKKLKLHPYNLLGKLLRSLGSVNVVIAIFVVKVCSNVSETDADAKAIQAVRQARPLTSVLGKVKHSEFCGVALRAYYVDEIKHLCIHVGNRSSRLAFLGSSRPSLDTRIRAIGADSAVQNRADVGAPVSIAVDSAAREAIAELESNQSAVGIEWLVTSPEIIGTEDEDATLSERGVFLMPNKESSLAALFALFLPTDERAKTPYLGSVAFAYNQKFSTLVRNIARDMPYELATERLGVIHFAARQLGTGLSPSAYSQLLLNLERLLKAQGLHNLMSYAALQLIRVRLSAEFPTLNKTTGKNASNASKRLLKPVEKMGEELSLLISLVLESTTLNRQRIESEYSRVLDCYSETDYPRRTGKESDIVDELEAAYQLMLMQPIAVRESFVQHCVHFSELDGCETAEMRSLLQVFVASLGCPVTIKNIATEPLLRRSA